MLLRLVGSLGFLKEGRQHLYILVMGGLFLYTLYAGYLGWQWRRVLTIQTETSELKKQVQPVAVTPDGNPAADVPKPSPVELKIQQLTEGMTPLTLSASVHGIKPSCDKDHCHPTSTQTAACFAAIYLIGADQFDETEREKMSSFFQYN